MKTNNACSALFLACLGLVAAQSGNNDPNGTLPLVKLERDRSNIRWQARHSSSLILLAITIGVM